MAKLFSIMPDQLKHISKLMSLALRHQPEVFGLSLNENGWVPVQQLLDGIRTQGIQLDMDRLVFIVESNDKKRFAFNETKTQIRASQGHSLPVELQLQACAPPDTLYHGTSSRFMDSILVQGLQKQNRHHVHLSAAPDTARAVGSRHGKPIVLHIDAKSMHAAGYTFFVSENNVWLTHQVPATYITL